MSKNGMSITVIACLVVALQRTIGRRMVYGYPPSEKGVRVPRGAEKLMRQLWWQPSERLWRSLKREEVYQKEHESVTWAVGGIGGGCRFYDHERLHQGLGNRTPAEAHTKRVAYQGNELVGAR